MMSRAVPAGERALARRSKHLAIGSSKSLIKAPRFTGLKPASEASSRAKRANLSRGTEQEILLCRELRRSGLRFRRNVKMLPGIPDVVFPTAQIAVFCDGDFWHGRKWRTLRAKLKRGSNSSYWIGKIKANIQRDRRNTRLLEESGWLVIRIWESDIRGDPVALASQLKEIVTERLRTLA
jgi:DNA mismatch endonuclease (patch repair protein)